MAMPCTMLSKLPIFFVLLTAPLALHAASQEQEYQQVRTIALRDPKVRAAYEDADRRLEEKILKIDPALAGYVRRRTSGGVVHEAPAPVSVRKPAPAPTKTASTAKPTTGHFERTHVVLKGETLTSIAGIFGVTVDSLKAANHIVDERKLAVGQKLEIPDRMR
jgi:hypothetical protein